MTTNNFPGVGYITNGRDFNYYKSLTITETTFGGNSVDGYEPSAIITFPTYGVILTNESGDGYVVEYSLNGNTVHGVLDGKPTSTTRIMTFLNRPVSCIWFRLQNGSSSPAVVTITAWGIR